MTTRIIATGDSTSSRDPGKIRILHRPEFSIMGTGTLKVEVLGVDDLGEPDWVPYLDKQALIEGLATQRLMQLEAGGEIRVGSVTLRLPVVVPPPSEQQPARSVLMPPISEAVPMGLTEWLLKDGRYLYILGIIGLLGIWAILTVSG